MNIKEHSSFRQNIWKIFAMSILMILAIGLLTPAKAHADTVKMGTIKMNPNTTKQLTVKASGEAGIAWSSSKDTICSAIKSGLIQSHSIGGSCYIYAKVNGGNTYRWKIKVYQLKMKTQSLTLMKRRGTKTLTLSPKTAQKKADWQSSNPNVASVNGKGVVTPHASGNALITATWNGVSVSASVQVLSANLNNMTKYYPSKKNRQTVVMIGSTLFDHWSTAEKDFGSTPVVNNAFHQATIADFSKHYKKLITNYKPKAVVICLGTDEIHKRTINGKEGLPLETVEEACVKQMQTLITRIHKKSKKTKIFFVSLPLYPNRSADLWAAVNDYNSDMKAYCKKHKKYLTYLNLQGALMKGKKPNSAYFSGTESGGNLYLTTAGYGKVKSVIVKKAKKAAK